MNRDRNILFKPIVVFLIAMGFCILFSEQNSVAWTIVSKHIKDVFIVVLLIIIMNITDSLKAKLSGVIMISYFVSLFSLRLGCAINSSFNYDIYKLSVNNPNIGLLVNSIILILLLLIITSNAKHER